jgi:hypothetical protein
MQSVVNAIKITGDNKCHIWPHIKWIIILKNTWLKFDVFYFKDDIILLMLQLASNKIDTYLTSLWRHERYLFSVFRGILPAICRRFSKKLSISVVVHRIIFYQIIKINKTQILLKYLLVHEVLNFLKNDWEMFKYYKGLDVVLMFEKRS